MIAVIQMTEMTEIPPLSPCRAVSPTALLLFIPTLNFLTIIIIFANLARRETMKKSYDKGYWVNSLQGDCVPLLPAVI